MAFCMNCGSQLPDGSRFCGNCGSPQGEMPAGGAPMNNMGGQPGMMGGQPGMQPGVPYDPNRMERNGVFFTKADTIDFEIFGDDMQAVGGESLNTMVGYIYDALGNQEGRASAAALILFAIIFVVTMINMYVSKKKTHY